LSTFLLFIVGIETNQFTFYQLALEHMPEYTDWWKMKIAL